MPESPWSWELLLRGGVAGLLVFHLAHLCMTQARPAARLALGALTLSVLAYIGCSMPQPGPLQSAFIFWPMLALCVATAAWIWVAACAVFDDGFRFSAGVVAILLVVISIGLVLHHPDAREVLPSGMRTPLVIGYGLVMLCFIGASLWEIGRDWRADLVEPRRTARRWVAMAIAAYALLVLTVELALRDRVVDRVLPMLHLAGIGSIALGLALAVARYPLAEILGIGAGPVPGIEAAAPRSAMVHVNSREATLLARLEQAMTVDCIYRREGLSLAGLAELLGVPQALLRSLINQKRGFRNFNDFLHHYRLGEACERLRAQDLPVLSIALECGYASIGPFNRAFKQRMGMTPTEFRAAARVQRAQITI